MVATEAALWGSVKAHGFLPDTVIVSDDAGQSTAGRASAALMAPSFPRASISSMPSTAGWTAASHLQHSFKSPRRRSHLLPSRHRARCAAIRNGRDT
jgi:hypothetical protein